MASVYKESDIQILRWHEAVRRRPEMCLGEKGLLSLRSMARRLFECPLDPRRLKVVDIELLDAASNAVFAMHC